jgi:hypothetical protein
MLIIEIILTIFAWRNGWKWLSLLPIGIALLIGISVGFGIGVAGGNPNVSLPGLSLIDIAAIIVLIVMVSKKPKSAVKTDETPKV